MLDAAETDMASVLDLYAGSGALGIEALSRGAERCLFVDANRRACDVVRDNLRRAGFEDRGAVVAARVGRWHPRDGEVYSLVLADPPYDDAAAWADIEHTLSGALDAGATLAIEHAARTEPPDRLAGCPRWRTRRQGDGAIAAYRCGMMEGQAS
jgi:16S rRNA (guanine(966)-N(2))-methyltransferase RsmD